MEQNGANGAQFRKGLNKGEGSGGGGREEEGGVGGGGRSGRWWRGGRWREEGEVEGSVNGRGQQSGAQLWRDQT